MLPNRTTIWASLFFHSGSESGSGSGSESGTVVLRLAPDSEAATQRDTLLKVLLRGGG
jgi:hypothetical protein